MTLATTSLRGHCSVGGDKSISHRAAIAGAIARGTTRIRGYSDAGDCAATLRAIRRLGATVEQASDGSLAITGADIAGDLGDVDVERSGTSMRLLAGVLAARACTVTLTGDEQLLRRPMERVAAPLRLMGADVTTTGGRAPLHISGGGLHGIRYEMPVASAQVKSALLLAGLGATGTTTVVEPAPSRDHTELLLAAMGAALHSDGTTVSVEPGELGAIAIDVPGDPSSAAFLICAAALVPGSDVIVENVCLNPTRIHFVEVLRRMGADIEVISAGVSNGGETVGALRCRHRALTGTHIVPAEVPLVIDELPILALTATAADGETTVSGAAELRVKESDRISALVAGLNALGAVTDELTDGFVIHGATPLHGGVAAAHRDHRLAMTWEIAALVTAAPVVNDGAAWIGDSFPGFGDALRTLRTPA